mmetsp:Transcript_9099/g.33571  ORF Transcript_9099/g.33571 Transcript_9099/m.33571 type:complete len:353 (-) Transcript_9099:3121-4179(-)
MSSHALLKRLSSSRSSSSALGNISTLQLRHLSHFQIRHKSNTVNVSLQRFEYKPHRSHRIKPYIRIDPPLTMQGREVALIPLTHGLTDIVRKQLEPGDEIEISKREKGFEVEQRSFKEDFPFPEYPQTCPCVRETVLTRNGDWLYCTGGGKKCLGVLLPKLKFFLKNSLKISSTDLEKETASQSSSGEAGNESAGDEEGEQEEEEEQVPSSTNLGKILRQLVRKRIIQSIPDLLRLRKKEQDIVETHKIMTQEEFNRFADLIDERKASTNLPIILYGLSVMVQRHAKLISEQYRTVEEMLDTCTHYSALTRLEGVENNKAHEIFVGMSYLRDIYPELKMLGVNFSNPLAEKK